jgi:UDP-N-acetylglucosamine 2-epimerase (non-hydrolysing)
VEFVAPFSFTDYLRLQIGAWCVLSDSGTVTEEASLLNFPAVTMREAHERPEGMDAGTLVMSTLGFDELMTAIKIARDGVGNGRFAGRVPDYEGPSVSAKVTRIVSSYIDYVNRVVWSDDSSNPVKTRSDLESNGSAAT